MKKAFFLTALLAACSLTACGGNDDPSSEPSTPPAESETTERESADDFVRGADISWYTEMAADGKKFYNSEGEAAECPDLMRQIGMNAVRLRVWVHPETKGTTYCDVSDVVRKAEAAWKANLNVMIDFHYSDWWADPSRQETPEAWKNLDLTALTDSVANHTRSVLSAIKAKGISVDWVQIGNETRNGMLHPLGMLWDENGDKADGYSNFAQLYQAGYEAAKAVFPQAKVMPHLNHAYEDNAWWLDRLLQNGGKFDMIALSHYPQADNDAMTWQQLNSTAIQRISQLAERFDVPVLVAELGARQNDEEKAKQVIHDFMRQARQLPTTTCAGVFYWEPEVYGGWKPQIYNEWGWDAYDMGAFTDQGRPSAALDAFKAQWN